MICVYIIESEDRIHWYIGITDDVDRRLKEHNSGRCIHTNKYKPWNIKSYTAFTDRNRAEVFEKYLKSHSGRAFAKKHL
jgi:putative endonuclease